MALRTYIVQLLRCVRRALPSATMHVCSLLRLFYVRTRNFNQESRRGRRQHNIIMHLRRDILYRDVMTDTPVCSKYFYNSSQL